MKPLALPRDFRGHYPTRSSLNVEVERLSLGDSGSPSASVVKSVVAYRESLQSSPASSARSQRSRGLDSEERSPKGDPDDRGSGKSERSERNDAGRSLSLSAGWRAVAAACHAGEGAGHE